MGYNKYHEDDCRIMEERFYVKDRGYDPRYPLYYEIDPERQQPRKRPRERGSSTERR